jgi:hypothetical protein
MYYVWEKIRNANMFDEKLHGNISLRELEI